MNLLYVPIFIWGLLFGSFLNVIIYRLPRNLSIVFPGSFCPNCNSPIPLYRNIPLVSFIIQKGKCANCKERISIRYPLIEFTNGVLWYLNFHFFDLNTATFNAILSSTVLAIIFIDFDKFIIPFKLIIFSGITIGLGIYFKSFELQKSIHGLIMGVGYLGFVFILTSLLLKKQAMGYGDLFLIAVLGAWLGPVKILFIIFLAAIFGIIYYILSKYFLNISLQKLPFGTFLGISSLILLFIKTHKLLSFIL